MWKSYQVAVWSLLAFLSLLFSLDGFPFPRPHYLFVIVGAIYTILFAQCYIEPRLTWTSVVSIVVSLSVTSFFLRWSMWSRLVIGSGDHVAHFWDRVGVIVREGQTISNGMYARNPLIHILWAENIIITDIWIFDGRFVAVVVSAIFPIFIIYLSKQFLPLRSSLFAGILAGPFPLVLRTGALFETEALVIPIYIIQLAIFFHILSNGAGIRFKSLLVSLHIILSFSHSLYPLIIIGILLGTLLIERVRWRDFLDLQNDRDIQTVSIIGVGGIFLLSTFRVFNSDLGSARVVRFITGSSTSLPTNPLQILIPQSGAIGSSIAASSGNGIANGTANGTAIIPPAVFNWVPVASLLLLSVVGGVYTLFRVKNERQSQIFVIITIVTTVTTIIFVFLFRSSTTMHIGYRSYYFLGIIAVVFAALGAGVIWDLKSGVAGDSKVQIISVILIVVFFSYVTIAPMSTIGNNQDPQFGGLQKGMTFTEKQQLDNIDTHIKGDDRIHPQPDLRYTYIRGPFVPSGDTQMGAELHSQSKECQTTNRIWSSDQYTICIPQES